VGEIQRTAGLTFAGFCLEAEALLSGVVFVGDHCEQFLIVSIFP
jgi:hypothetical protein